MICPFCFKNVPLGSPQCPKCLAGVSPDLLPPFSGIFRRLMALFLDGFIGMVIAAPFVVLMFLFMDDKDKQTIFMLAMVVVMGIWGLIQLILLFSTGQTVGKKLLRIKIIRLDYTPAGFGTLFMREIIGRFVCGLTLGIGYLIALFNPQKMGLHDKIAKTIVVRKLRPAEAAAMITQPAAPVDFAQSAYAAPEPAEIPSFVPAPLMSPPPPPPPPMTPAAAPAAPPKKSAAAGPTRAEAVTCHGCGSPIEDLTSKFCLVCGYPVGGGVRAFTRFCTTCKSPLTDADVRCSKCGQPVAAPAPVVPSVASAPPPEAEATVMVTAPKLVSYSGEGQQEVFTLQLPVTKIGRQKDNHICFEQEKSVSGHHCEIYLEGSQFFIRDLGSTNGVFVNNRKVDTSPLADGDKVKLGFKILRFTQS